MCLDFSEKNFVTKSVPPQKKSLFEITMGNPFLNIFCDDRNAQKKIKIINKDILIWNLLSESICDFGETEIMPIKTIGVIGIISVVPLPEAWYWFQKQI